jgi:inorganic pyrophosphatase
MIHLYDLSMLPAVFIEIEKYSNIKYEWNHQTNTLEIDRILSPPFVYPFSYGFFPKTLGKDGDELDILVISNTEFSPNTTISEVEIIGGLYMEDEKGEDEKIFVVPKGDSYFYSLTETQQKYVFELCEWFFSNYKKNTDAKWSKTRGFMNLNEAIQCYNDSIVRYHLSSVSSFSNKNILCLLTKQLTDEWMSFLLDEMNNIANNDANPNFEYSIYIVVDNNTIDYQTEYYREKLKKKPIHIIQLHENVCSQANYYKSSSWTNLKDVIAWDKALFYFNRINTQYDSIWFMEEDVFLSSLQLIRQIDNRYKTEDLLTSFHEINQTGNVKEGWNHWINVIHRIGTPWAHSLICICRLSRRLMERIDEYVSDRHLMIIESLFNTLAMHHQYTIAHPEEISEESIHFNKKWDLDHICFDKIYHPIKEMENHVLLRNRFHQLKNEK